MKRLLITGASRGLGEAIARLADNLGHKTVLVARDSKRLEQLQKELSTAHTIASNLAELDSLESTVARTLDILGGLDALINCAGTIEPISPLEGSSAQAWAQAIEVNLTAPALLMRACLPELRKNRGRIVNVSTGAAVKPMAGWSAYCASKAGLLHLTSVLAIEAPEVACFSLRPGVIDTGMQGLIRESQGMRESDQQRFLELHKQGQLEPPEVPARAAIWLALKGPQQRSGELIEYTDPEVLQGISALLG